MQYYILVASVVASNLYLHANSVNDDQNMACVDLIWLFSITQKSSRCVHPKIIDIDKWWYRTFHHERLQKADAFYYDTNFCRMYQKFCFLSYRMHLLLVVYKVFHFSVLVSLCATVLQDFHCTVNFLDTVAKMHIIMTLFCVKLACLEHTCISTRSSNKKSSSRIYTNCYV